ncbi:MAG: alpha/beta hydrolase-fold protein [Chloroflexi bacterium]|nr:alpha/beta hydrolase-fold protein [Chloroflexota bacterium]
MSLYSSVQKIHPHFLFYLVLTLILVSCTPSIGTEEVSPPIEKIATPSQSEVNPIAGPLGPVLIPDPNLCTDVGGKVLEQEIPTRRLEQPMLIKVYLPPCYESTPQREYPVLLMLHGQNDTYGQWERLGIFTEMDTLLLEERIQPFIVVLPYELNTLVDSGSSEYGEALIKEGIPYLQEHFNTCQTRTCWAIGGLSRGGNWALHLGFTHPQLFSAVGAHSAPLFYGEISNITKIMSKEDSILELPNFYIDVGNKDPDRQDTLSFVSLLKKFSIPFDFTEFIGYHQEDYWNTHVQDYLVWYSSQFVVSPNE